MESHSKDLSDKAYLTDAFSGVGNSAETFDPLNSGGEHSDTAASQAISLVAELGFGRYEFLQKILPDEIARFIQHADQKTLRFLFSHIDVDTYQSASDVFSWVEPHLSVGSRIIFESYGFLGCEGVTGFCNELKGVNRFYWYHNLNGHFPSLSFHQSGLK